jgi:colicin import membrane protein
MKPATAGGPYKVPRQSNGLRSGMLAVAMHAMLLLFLWVGVSWQNNQPTEVQAEIWDMKVQDAAPPAPTPEPTPEPEPEPQPVVKAPPPPQPVEAPPVPKVDPEIALERLKAKKKEEDRLDKLEQARLKKEADEKLAKLEAKKKADQKAKEDKEKAEQDALDKEKALADKKKAAAEKLTKDKAEKADKAAKDKAFAAEMSRITGSAAKGSTGTAAQSTGGRVDGGYAAAIKAKIKSNLVYGSEDDSLTASYVITQLPTGEIIGTRKVKGSGSTAYDSAIENAIAKSSPLPKKKDGTVEREINLDFKLKDMH